MSEFKRQFAQMTEPLIKVQTFSANELVFLSLKEEDFIRTKPVSFFLRKKKKRLKKKILFKIRERV